MGCWSGSWVENAASASLNYFRLPLGRRHGLAEADLTTHLQSGSSTTWRSRPVKGSPARPTSLFGRLWKEELRERFVRPPALRGRAGPCLPAGPCGTVRRGETDP